MVGKKLHKNGNFISGVLSVLPCLEGDAFTAMTFITKNKKLR